jgi:DNA-binding transcriptional MocR family regulator
VADGNPDPALLPSHQAVLGRLRGPARLYGEATNRPDLLEVAGSAYRADGIPADHVAIVGGALDGLERALQAHLRPGDRIGLEDPGFTGVLDLVGALGLVPEPFGIDDFGPRPEDVAGVLKRGAAGIILTPRAQNPRGSALDERRSRELSRVLESHPEVLVIEDDHAWAVAGTPCQTLVPGRQRWAVVRSVAKSLGPDLRLAFLTGDALTVSRIEGRQALGTGWVSHILQRVVASLLTDPGTEDLLGRAAAAYRERRGALLEALKVQGIEAHGRSGLNCWIPVREEVTIVTAMAASGWALRGTESYRIKSPPAIRVTVSTLHPAECPGFAAALAQAFRGRPTTPLT